MKALKRCVELIRNRVVAIVLVVTVGNDSGEIIETETAGNGNK